MFTGVIKSLRSSAESIRLMFDAGGKLVVVCVDRKYSAISNTWWRSTRETGPQKSPSTNQPKGTRTTRRRAAASKMPEAAIGKPI